MTSVLPLNHIGCHSHISGAQVSVTGIYCVRVDGVNERMSECGGGNESAFKRDLFKHYIVISRFGGRGGVGVHLFSCLSLF